MHSHSGLQMFSTVMDFVLLLVSFWMAYTAKKMNLGGAVGKTISMVVSGAVVLGLAHLVETVLSSVFQLPHETNELIHRGIVLVGFILLTLGLSSLGKSLRPTKRKQ